MFKHACRSIAALERALSTEKIRQGMRRAEYEGQRLGRAPLQVDRTAIVHDRLSGMSLTVVATKYGVSRASVVRYVREAQRRQPGQVGGLSDEWEHRAAAAECVA
jgi:DNA invertase Pin-like site-specific DNA recombinase